MTIKAKHFLYAGAFIVLTIIGILIVPKNEELIIDGAGFISGEQDVSIDNIYVHIIGAINEPGIKEVPKYTRLFELIELSGGTTENADISRLNLASVLKDEQKIVVPERIEENIVDISKASNTIISNTEYLIKGTMININTANKDQLSTLPGIGPSMSQRIIDYRDNNGYFNSIEDVKNVSGIGDAKFEKIKDFITVY